MIYTCRVIVLLLAAALAAEPVSAAARDSDAEFSSDMLQEMEKSQEANRENALARSAAEAARTHETVRGLFSAASRDLKAMQALLDPLSKVGRDPARKPSDPQEEASWAKVDEISKSLSVSSRLLLQKAQAYGQKASSAFPVPAAEEKEPARAQTVYVPNNREADLKSAKRELAAAQARWGAKSLKPAQKEAAAALADYLAELKGAVTHCEAARALIGSSPEKPVHEIASRLRATTDNVAREAELLTTDLLLSRYDADLRQAR